MNQKPIKIANSIGNNAVWVIAIINKSSMLQMVFYEMFWYQ